MTERTSNVSQIVAFLQGADLLPDLTTSVRHDAEMVARAILYMLQQRKYHRKNLSKALLALMTHGSPAYRQVAWALLQLVPLSHLLELRRVCEKPSKENTKRLRQALVCKIANEPLEEIIRAYFMAPKLYRQFFAFFRLPTTTFNGKPITHETYKVAAELAEMTTQEAFKRRSLDPVDLVKEYGVPLHMVFAYVTDPDQAEQIAVFSSSDDFFRHARWFRSVIGDEGFERLAFKKLRTVKDPLSFLAIKDHLEATNALTPELSKELERRTETILQKELQDAEFERLALIVDVSGSMQAAREITVQLHEAFSHFGKTITDLIAFNNVAFDVELNRLKELPCDGFTSIGAGFQRLYTRLQARAPQTHPDVILLVTDLGENTPPFMKDTLPLLKEGGRFMPLIIILCGYYSGNAVIGDYPHAIIEVKGFHSRLLLDVIRQIISLSKKVKKEEKITKVVKTRRPLEELLGELVLPERPPETLRPGFLERLLTS